MITIAICTYNREEMALKAAADAFDQLPAGGELLIIDQTNPPCARLAALEESGRARYFHLHLPSLTHARNLAASRSRHEFIFYLDDDARLRPGTLAAHISEIGKPGIGGSSGPIHDDGVASDPKTGIVTGKISVSGKHVQNRGGREYQFVDTLFGGNMVLNVEALKRAGGFETGFTGLATWEETCLSFRLARLGYRLTFNPAAPVDHFPQVHGNLASARSKKLGIQYYSNYVRNGTCAFLRGRPIWQQIPFVARHLALCEWRGLGLAGIPGLGTVAFLRGYAAGWWLFLRRGKFPTFPFVVEEGA